MPAADQEETDFELFMVRIATNEVDSTHTDGHGNDGAVRNAVGDVVVTDDKQLIISLKKSLLSFIHS